MYGLGCFLAICKAERNFCWKLALTMIWGADEVAILSYLIYLSLSVYLSVCLSIFPSVHLSIHPSIHPSIYLSTITHPNSKHFRRCRFSWISLEETKKTCEPRKKKSEVPHFLLNPGCLIGILIIVYDNPHTTG